MRVLFLSPGYPTEMTDFVRGLAETGADVVGMGDQHPEQVPFKARAALEAYVQVSFDDEQSCVDAAADLARRAGGFDRVESLWEPLMILAARIRNRLGLPGLTVDETVPFRDKEHMKAALDAAGIRTPHHYRAGTETEVRAAVERIGYPIIVKPIAGAGSGSTYRVNHSDELGQAMAAVRGVPEVSVEEFVEADEFTFDTICANGEILFHNVCWYRPRPLVGMTTEWISQQTIALKEPDVDHLAPGVEMGRRVIEALNFRDGFTHMEWYLKEDGEAVFGEIGARPPGGRTVDLMNYASDIDLFRWWASAVVHGSVPGPVVRTYNAASVYKRAEGHGRIIGYAGLDDILGDLGEHVVALELNPIGQPRRDWRSQLVGDGLITVRHPDLQTTIEMADRLGSDLRILAG